LTVDAPVVFATGRVAEPTVVSPVEPPPTVELPVTPVFDGVDVSLLQAAIEVDAATTRAMPARVNRDVRIGGGFLS